MLAAGASAAPEYRTCIKMPEKNGHYTAKTCSSASFTAEAVGKWERADWNKGRTTAFSAKTKGAPLAMSFVHDPRGCKIREPETGFCHEVGDASTPAEIYGSTGCKKAAVKGQVTGPDTATWEAEYTGCGWQFGACTTAGKPEGTIVTDELETTLVNLDKGPGHEQVGIRLKGLGPSGRLAEYQCGNRLDVETIYGEALGEVKGDLNSASKKSEVVFNEGPLVAHPLYEEGAHTEEEGKAYLDWAFELEACVRRKIEKGATKLEAEEACSAELGSAPAPAPIMLSEVQTFPEATFTAPALQQGALYQKGESMLIEDN
jgi:hypothetical protein